MSSSIPTQPGIIPMGRMAEMRATGIFFAGLLAPIFVPLLRGLIPFVIYVAALAYFVHKHKAGPLFSESPDLSGRTIIVTGANTGIGRETVVKLVQLGANVVLACRSAERTAAALAQCRAIAKVGQTVEFIRLDLQDFDVVHSFVNEFNSKYAKLDVLINNAGVMMCPFELTKHGYENQYNSNHLSHFLLTMLLTPKLKASGRGRVVNVASEGQALTIAGTSEAVIAQIHDAKTYNLQIAYGVSKLANVQFSYEYNRRAAAANLPITAYSVHPGVVDTELMRHFPAALNTILTPLIRLVMKTSFEGAQTSLFAALSDSAVPGRYHMDVAQQTPCKWGYDEGQVTALWDRSVIATKLPKEFDLRA